MTKPTWITVNPNQGSGNTSVAVTATHNSGGYREGSMDISVPGFPTTVVSVAQYPGDTNICAEIGNVLRSTPNSPLVNYSTKSSFNYKNAREITIKMVDGESILKAVDPSIYLSPEPIHAIFFSISESYVGERGTIEIVGDFFDMGYASGDIDNLIKWVSKIELYTRFEDLNYSGWSNIIDSYTSFIYAVNKSVETKAIPFTLVMFIRGIRMNKKIQLLGLRTSLHFNLKIAADMTTTSSPKGVPFIYFVGSHSEELFPWSFTSSLTDEESYAEVFQENSLLKDQISVSNYSSKAGNVQNVCGFYASWDSLYVRREFELKVTTFVDFRIANDTTVINNTFLTDYFSKVSIISAEKNEIVVDLFVVLRDVISSINSQQRSRAPEFTLHLDLKDMTFEIKNKLMALVTVTNFNITIVAYF